MAKPQLVVSTSTVTNYDIPRTSIGKCHRRLLESFSITGPVVKPEPYRGQREQ